MIDSDFLILAVVSFTRELVVNFYCKSTANNVYKLCQGGDAYACVGTCILALITN